MYTCTANSIADMTLKTVLKLNMALKRTSKVRFLQILGKPKKEFRLLSIKDKVTTKLLTKSIIHGTRVLFPHEAKNAMELRNNLQKYRLGLSTLNTLLCHSFQLISALQCLLLCQHCTSFLCYITATFCVCLNHWS
jgi:hypothetical protein